MKSKTIRETPRLILREFELTDAAAVLGFNSDPVVTRYTGDKGKMKTLDDARTAIKDIWQKGYREHGYARLAAVDKSSNQVIGFCGLKYLPEYNMADIGYRFIPSYWGKGLATEGASAAMEYGFEVLKLDKIMGMAMPGNVASIKVLEKIGLEPKGQIVDQGIDVELFEVNREHFLRNK